MLACFYFQTGARHHGLLSWDAGEHQVDLEKELATLTAQAPEGEEARYGERLIQYASENLVTEILIHPQMNTLMQCMRNLLSSFTRHRHLVHAGYTFAGNGSWIMQDGTFSLADFTDAYQENEVQRVIRAYENSISIDIHCSVANGEWAKLPDMPFVKHCKIRVNPTDTLDSGSPAIKNFIAYLEPYIVPASLEQLLVPSDVVGNIRFSHPTLYVFPGGQGDAALFGINGFNMLVDGGFSRKACWWDFARHLDRLDAVLFTRLNNCSMSGMAAVLHRKATANVYPQIGHFFCNLEDRRGISSPDGDKDSDPLMVSLLQAGSDMMADLRHINLKPQHCYRSPEPINLYHKVGHGTLDMFVLNPSKDSKYVRDFLKRWHNSEQKLFEGASASGPFNFPIPNLVSICALLVWRPANPDDNITRIMFPGSTPQHKIFEGLEKLKHLEFLQRPTYTGRQMSAASNIATSKTTATLSTAAPIKNTKTLASKINREKIEKKDEKSIETDMQVSKFDKIKEVSNNVIDNKLISELVDEENKQLESVLNEAIISHVDTKLDEKILQNDIAKDSKQKKGKKKEKSTDIKTKRMDKTDETKDTTHSKFDTKKIDVDSKLKAEAKKKSEKPKSELYASVTKSRTNRITQKVTDRKTTTSLDKKIVADDKKSPPATPKKSIDVKSQSQLAKDKVKLKTRKVSPGSTPAKSVKEASNRRVVESKYKQASPKRDLIQKAGEKREPKMKREPISRRPRPVTSPIKGLKSAKSPSKSIKSSKADTSKLMGLQRVNYEDILKEAKKSDEETSKSFDEIKQQEFDEREEQEIVREIEAVFNRDSEVEERVEYVGRSDIEKITCLLDDTKTGNIDGDFEEEYLIIEKEEVEQYTEDSIVEKEDELRKHIKDKEESEKKQISEIKADLKPETITQNGDQDKRLDSKEHSISVEEKQDISSEKKTSDSKSAMKPKDSIENIIQESQPEEKVSTTIESGATTAPTLPEDERITLDDIKEDELVEEKYVKEQTKEVAAPKTLIDIQNLTSFEKSSKQTPQQTLIREIVKTPDEVADLPLHEEVDYRTYEEKKTPGEDVSKRKIYILQKDIKVPKDLAIIIKPTSPKETNTIQDVIVSTTQRLSHPELVTVTPGSAPDSPMYQEPSKLEKSVKSLDPVKEYDDERYNFSQFTEKLRETHITTVDSPIKDDIVVIEELHMPEKIPSIPEDVEKEIEEAQILEQTDKPPISPKEVEKIVADVAEVLKSDKSLDELIAEKSPILLKSPEKLLPCENIAEITTDFLFDQRKITSIKSIKDELLPKSDEVDTVIKSDTTIEKTQKEVSPIKSLTSEDISDPSEKTVLSETKKIKTEIQDNNTLTCVLPEVEQETDGQLTEKRVSITLDSAKTLEKLEEKMADLKQKEQIKSTELIAPSLDTKDIKQTDKTKEEILVKEKEQIDESIVKEPTKEKKKESKSVIGSFIDKFDEKLSKAKGLFSRKSDKIAETSKEKIKTEDTHKTVLETTYKDLTDFEKDMIELLSFNEDIQDYLTNYIIFDEPEETILEKKEEVNENNTIIKRLTVTRVIKTKFMHKNGIIQKLKIVTIITTTNEYPNGSIIIVNDGSAMLTDINDKTEFQINELADFTILENQAIDKKQKEDIVLLRDKQIKQKLSIVTVKDILTTRNKLKHKEKLTVNTTKEMFIRDVPTIVNVITIFISDYNLKTKIVDNKKLAKVVITAKQTLDTNGSTIIMKDKDLQVKDVIEKDISPSKEASVIIIQEKEQGLVKDSSPVKNDTLTKDKVIGKDESPSEEIPGKVASPIQDQGQSPALEKEPSPVKDGPLAKEDVIDKDDKVPSPTLEKEPSPVKDVSLTKEDVIDKDVSPSKGIPEKASSPIQDKVPSPALEKEPSPVKDLSLTKEDIVIKKDVIPSKGIPENASSPIQDKVPSPALEEEPSPVKDLSFTKEDVIDKDLSPSKEIAEKVTSPIIDTVRSPVSEKEPSCDKDISVTKEDVIEKDVSPPKVIPEKSSSTIKEKEKSPVSEKEPSPAKDISLTKEYVTEKDESPTKEIPEKSATTVKDKEKNPVSEKEPSSDKDISLTKKYVIEIDVSPSKAIPEKASSPIEDKVPRPASEKEQSPVKEISLTKEDVIKKDVSPSKEILEKTASPIEDKVPSPASEKEQSPVKDISLTKKDFIEKDVIPSTAIPEKASSPIQDKVPSPALEKVASPVKDVSLTKEDITEKDESPLKEIPEHAASPIQDKEASPAIDKEASPVKDISLAKEEVIKKDVSPSKEIAEKAASPTQDKEASPALEKEASPVKDISLAKEDIIKKDVSPSKVIPEKAPSPTQDKVPSPALEKEPSPVKDISLAKEDIIKNDVSPSKEISEKAASPIQDKEASTALEKEASPVKDISLAKEDIVIKKDVSPSKGIPEKASSPIQDKVPSPALEKEPSPVKDLSLTKEDVIDKDVSPSKEIAEKVTSPIIDIVRSPVSEKEPSCDKDISVTKEDVIEKDVSPPKVIPEKSSSTIKEKEKSPVSEKEPSPAKDISLTKEYVTEKDDSPTKEIPEKSATTLKDKEKSPVSEKEPSSDKDISLTKKYVIEIDVSPSKAIPEKASSPIHDKVASTVTEKEPSPVKDISLTKKDVIEKDESPLKEILEKASSIIQDKAPSPALEKEPSTVKDVSLIKEDVIIKDVSTTKEISEKSASPIQDIEASAALEKEPSPVKDVSLTKEDVIKKDVSPPREIPEKASSPIQDKVASTVTEKEPSPVKDISLTKKDVIEKDENPLKEIIEKASSLIQDKAPSPALEKEPSSIKDVSLTKEDVIKKDVSPLKEIPEKSSTTVLEKEKSPVSEKESSLDKDISLTKEDPETKEDVIKKDVGSPNEIPEKSASPIQDKVSSSSSKNTHIKETYSIKEELEKYRYDSNELFATSSFNVVDRMLSMKDNYHNGQSNGDLLDNNIRTINSSSSLFTEQSKSFSSSEDVSKEISLEEKYSFESTEKEKTVGSMDKGTAEDKLYSEGIKERDFSKDFITKLPALDKSAQLIESIQKAFGDESIQQGIKTESTESLAVHSFDRVSTPPTVPVSPLPKTLGAFHDVKVSEGVQSEISYDRSDGSDETITKTVHVGEDVLTQRISTSTEKVPKSAKSSDTTESLDLQALTETVGKIKTETDTVTKVIKEGENVVTQTITTVTTKEVISKEDGTPQNVKTTIETTTLCKSSDGSTTTTKDTQTVLSECSSTLKSTSHMDVDAINDNKVVANGHIKKSHVFDDDNLVNLPVKLSAPAKISNDDSDEITINTDVSKRVIQDNGIDIIETVTRVTKKETIEAEDNKKVSKTTVETNVTKEKPDGSKDEQKMVEVKTEEIMTDVTSNIDNILSNLKVFETPEESITTSAEEIQDENVLIKRITSIKTIKTKYADLYNNLKKLKTITIVTTTDQYPDGSSNTKVNTSISLTDLCIPEVDNSHDLKDFTCLEDRQVNVEKQEKTCVVSGENIKQLVTTTTTDEVLSKLDKSQRKLKRTIETVTESTLPNGFIEVTKDISISISDYLTEADKQHFEGFTLLCQPKEETTTTRENIEMNGVLIKRQVTTTKTYEEFVDEVESLKKTKTTIKEITEDEYPDGSIISKTSEKVSVFDEPYEVKFVSDINTKLQSKEDLLKKSYVKSSQNSDLLLTKQSVEDLEQLENMGKDIHTDTKEGFVLRDGKSLRQIIKTTTTKELMSSEDDTRKKIKTTVETITETELPNGSTEVVKDVKVSIAEYGNSISEEDLHGYFIIGEPDIKTESVSERVVDNGTEITRRITITTTKQTFENTTSLNRRLKTVVVTITEDAYPDGTVLTKKSERISITDISSENLTTDEADRVDPKGDLETVEATTEESDVKKEIVLKDSAKINRTITTKTKRETLGSKDKNIRRLRTTVETITEDEYPDGSVETTKDVKITISEFQKANDNDLQAALDGFIVTGKVRNFVDKKTNIITDNLSKITQNITTHITKEELNNKTTNEVAVRTVTQTVTENIKEDGSIETTKDVRTQIAYLPAGMLFEDLTPEEGEVNITIQDKESPKVVKPIINELNIMPVEQKHQEIEPKKKRSPVGEITTETETFNKIIKEDDKEIHQTVTVVTTKEVISPEKVKVTVETTTVCKGSDGVTKTTKSTKTTISEFKEEYEEIIDTGDYDKSPSKYSSKAGDMRSSSVTSDYLDQLDMATPPSDISSRESRVATHVWGTESSGMYYSDEDGQASPSSTKSQIAHSPKSNLSFELPLQQQDQDDPMSMSVYGQLPGDFGEYSEDTGPSLKTITGDFLTHEKIKTDSDNSNEDISVSRFLKEADEQFEKAIEEHKKISGSTVISSITAKYELDQDSQASGSKETSKSQESTVTLREFRSDSKKSSSHRDENTKMSSTKSHELSKDPIESWGKPLGLPSPILPSDGKSTPKKQAASSSVANKNKMNQDKNKEARVTESPSKKKTPTPIYMDLTYVPHHGNSYYSAMEFFKRVRARYYVFSGTEPSKEIYNALLDAKKTWEDKNLEVTIIPTYDTDVLGYWVAENEEALEKYKIDLSPSASRCTINLQDHETSCAAYRLEF
ncbi:unnamed protein product [Pieris macdunnoughi]|uniref:Microtubule-associated protein futsch n=1 Tax=Pieris macdunnoughi TaxID=345717 RepID=A0A821SND0_9NEOP|nr:unnamed protein product [Pieris macdunnoughi]